MSTLLRRSLSGLIVLWVLVAAPGSGGAAAPTDDGGLTAYAAAAITRALPGAKVTVSGPLLLVVDLASQSFVVRLDNIAGYCRRDTAGCERAVQDFIAGMAATVNEAAAPVQRSELRAVVRRTGYIDDLRRMAAGVDVAKPIVRPLAGDLWLLCVADRPHGVKALTVGDIAKLHLSEDEAVALAERNLAAALRPLGAVVHDLPPNGVGTIGGDFYDSSRLILHDDWAPLSLKLHGHLVVAVPANDVLLYGEGKDRVALDAIATLAVEAARRSQRLLSPSLLTWAPGGWTIVTP